MRQVIGDYSDITCSLDMSLRHFCPVTQTLINGLTIIKHHTCDSGPENCRHNQYFVVIVVL